MSVLFIGLLGALLAGDAPSAVTNAAAAAPNPAVASIPAINTNDPVEKEYYQIMLDDDAAEKEVLGWMNSADTLARAGGGRSQLTLNLRIQQRLDVIKKEYQDFVERHPKHVNARLAFGSFLNDNNEQDAAFKQWDEARQLAPDNPAAWDNLGNYYGENEQATNAFKCYDKAIELNPSQPIYYHNLAATVYLFQNDAQQYYHLNGGQVFEKSLSLYRHAIKMDPNNFILYSDYAECFYGVQPPRWTEGLQAWNEALKLAPGEVEKEGVHLHLARIQLHLGDYDDARKNLDIVTNANYAKLKNSLEKNLSAALAKTSSNSAAPPK